MYGRDSKPVEGCNRNIAEFSTASAMVLSFFVLKCQSGKGIVLMRGRLNDVL